jgi:transposase
MAKNRQANQLDEWMKEAADSDIEALKNFAKGLKQDYDAVKAALTYEWSNGQVEGHVNRLKTIKRQMYGRAGFSLLKKRILLHTG